MNEIVLAGCTSTPLANYLKALGVLRLLSQQATDHSFKAFWRNGVFVLQSSTFSGHIEHDCETVCSFFLKDYQPSALVTPWNGRGGFLEGESDEGGESSRAGALMVRLFTGDSVARRFAPLSSTLKSIADISEVSRLNSARAKLKALNANKKSKGKKNLKDSEKDEIQCQEKLVRNEKSGLLQALRNQLPDEILDWFDTCLALARDPKDMQSVKSVPVPLLGVGGLDGSMDFGVNYLKRINDIFDTETGKPRGGTLELLMNSLFSSTTDGLISKSPQDKKKVSVGQFNPAGAGGSNSNPGFSGEALLNPWDTLLQLEGAVLFAASVVRRLEGAGDVYASLPFTVAPFAIGEAIALSDESPKGAKRRTAEMWLPLWSKPATYSELNNVFREGRITLRGKSVTNGFDCVRALGEFGVYRGISSFQRIAFLKRSGDAFFALDLGRFDVKTSVYSNLIGELDSKTRFLTNLHSFVRKKKSSGDWWASSRLRRLAGRLDSFLVQVLSTDNRGALQSALILLGDIQHVVATNKKAQKSIPPIPQLSEQWVQAADDGTPAFRIARALAGLDGTQGTPLPLRAQLFPVHPKYNQWMTPDYIGKHAAKDPACRVRIHTARKGRLPDTLQALLARRLWLAGRFEIKDKPLRSPAGVTLGDITAFLSDAAMDARIAALLPGLCLCRIPRDVEHGAGDGMAPAAFALLKLCLTPDQTLRDLHWLSEQDRLSVPPGLLAQLAAGNDDNRAVRLAWRRLRASGLAPLFTPDALPELGGINPRRAAAALLIPLRFGAIHVLARSVLEVPQVEAETA